MHTSSLKSQRLNLILLEMMKVTSSHPAPLPGTILRYGADVMKVNFHAYIHFVIESKVICIDDSTGQRPGSIRVSAGS